MKKITVGLWIGVLLILIAMMWVLSGCVTVKYHDSEMREALNNGIKIGQADLVQCQEAVRQYQAILQRAQQQPVRPQPVQTPTK